MTAMASTATVSLWARYDALWSRRHLKLFNAIVPGGLLAYALHDGGISRELLLSYLIVAVPISWRIFDREFGHKWKRSNDGERYRANFCKLGRELTLKKSLAGGWIELNRLIGLYLCAGVALAAFLLALGSIVFTCATAVAELAVLPFDFMWDLHVNFYPYATHLAHALLWFPDLLSGSHWAQMGLYASPFIAVILWPASGCISTIWKHYRVGTLDDLK